MRYYNPYYESQMEMGSISFMCECLHIDPVKLEIGWNELIVLNYMFCYIHITNRECRKEIGFGKTKTAMIFKKLVALGLVDKHGQGDGTYYMLKEEGYSGNDADYEESL